jgi:outer membrane protein assembly factor BamE
MGTRIRYDTFFPNRPNPSGFLAMRHLLIPVLLLSLAAGCSSFKIGPHRIDVQQGNALDQENVARLKPGLNRSQVRFLMGTPLLVDPFRTDRWDYVYVYYKAGKLAEQRHISLFFEGDTLARIEGDLPVVESPAQAPAAAARSAQKVETPASPSSAGVESIPASPAPRPAPVPEAVSPPDKAAVVSRPAPAAQTSIVPPLNGSSNAAVAGHPPPQAKLSLQAETDMAQIRPDVTPAFPEPRLAVVMNDDPILNALNDWASAWSRRDADAYFAAYDTSFVPQGGGRRADWERRRRLLIHAAKHIEVRVESPSVDRAEDGMAMVTFNQFYRSDSYRDAVVKQLRMIDRDGRWLIVEEKVVSNLRGSKP